MEGFDMFEPLELPIIHYMDILTHALPHSGSDYNIFTSDNDVLLIVHVKTGRMYRAMYENENSNTTSNWRLVGVKSGSIVLSDKITRMGIRRCDDTIELDGLFQDEETEEYFSKHLTTDYLSGSSLQCAQHLIKSHTEGLNNAHEHMNLMLELMRPVSTVSDSQFVLK